MLWRILEKLDFKQLFGLAWLFLRNPIYAVPTVLATKKCMAIAQREYGSKHHLSNKANAFRHALWVVLITRKCMEWKNNGQKAKLWAKKFTDWHEDFSPNKTLERTMDLHNNKVGILLFEEIKNRSEAAVVSFLKRKASEAIKIKTVEEVEKFRNELVYIKE